MKPRRATRLSLLAALCLLLGAVTTVGVAWALSNPQRRDRWTSGYNGAGFEEGTWYPAADIARSAARWTMHWREIAGTQSLQFRSLVTAGWPAVAMRSERIEDASAPFEYGWHFCSWDEGMLAPRAWGLQPWALPVRPLWPGFAIDTALYAAAWWLLICTPLALYRAARRRIRVSRGMCGACGYDLKGSPGGVCSECGAAAGAKA